MVAIVMACIVMANVIMAEFFLVYSHSGWVEGKGVWDGVGGIVKKKLTDAILKLGKLIKTPKDCYEYIDSVMCSEVWREAHMGGSIVEFVSFYAEEGEIDRSNAPYTYDSIPGIRTMRQFIRIEPGVIMARQFACWCPACWTVEGRGIGAMNTVGIVAGCTSAGDLHCSSSSEKCDNTCDSQCGWAHAYAWQEREVHIQKIAVRDAARKAAQDKWRANCLRDINDEPGQLLAVQLQLSKDHFGICRTVNSGNR